MSGAMKFFTINPINYYLPVGNAEGAGAGAGDGIGNGEGGGEGADGGASGSGSDNAGAGDGAGGGEGSGSGAGSSSSFDWSKWNGDPNTVPDSHREAFKAFEAQNQKRGREELNRLLQQHVSQKFADSRQKLPDIGDKQNLTGEQLKQILNERDRIQRSNDRIAQFQTGFEELVGAPAQFGEASILFSDTKEVDAFEAFIRETGKNGLTPRDFLLLFKQKEILSAHADARIRAFEKSLKKGNPNPGGSGGGGGSSTGGNSNASGGNAGDSLEEFIKQDNPGLYRAIMAGKVQL